MAFGDFIKRAVSFRGSGLGLEKAMSARMGWWSGGGGFGGSLHYWRDSWKAAVEGKGALLKSDSFYKQVTKDWRERKMSLCRDRGKLPSGYSPKLSPRSIWSWFCAAIKTFSSAVQSVKCVSLSDFSIWAFWAFQCWLVLDLSATWNLAKISKILAGLLLFLKLLQCPVVMRR